jgi:ankyrin repeat protein
MWAIKSGYTEIAELFLRMGADEKVKNEKNSDALSLARERGNNDIVSLIEEKAKKRKEQPKTSAELNA